MADGCTEGSYFEVFWGDVSRPIGDGKSCYWGVESWSVWRSLSSHPELPSLGLADTTTYY